MEKFGAEHQQIQETRERKIKLLEKAKKVFGVWAFSALAAITPLQAQSQSSYEKDVKKEGDLEIVIPSEKFQKSIEEQRDWLITYMHSQKYKERFTKEYIRARDFPNTSYEAFSKAHTKAYGVKDGDTLYVNGFEGWANDKGINLDSAKDINNVFPEPNMNISEYFKDFIEKNIQERINNVTNGSYVVVEKIPSSKPGYVTLGLYIPTNLKDDPNNGKVLLTQNLKKNYSGTPIHELTHQSTDGNMEIRNVTEYILQKYAQGNNEYLKDPAEIIARMNVLRYLLHKYAKYDASTEQFTIETLKKTLEDKKIMESDDVQELISLFEVDELIWLMNNIADANNGTNALFHLDYA